MSERERFDELEAALAAVFSGRDVPNDVGDEPRDLALLAGYLLGLPREEFRASLKADLVRPETNESEKKTEPSPKEETTTQTVIPYVVVPGAEQMMDFLREAFDATEVLRSAGSGGFHGEVRIGGSQVMMGGRPGMSWPEALATVHLYVPDADATYRRALAAGATSLYPPTDQFYGDREAGIRDPFGNRWFIATRGKGPSHVPEGMRSVTPFFLVNGTSEWMELLKRAFGAEEVARVDSPEGAVRYATMRIGDSIIEMGEAHGEHAASTPAMLYVIVEDVDAAYARAVAGGTQAVEAPTVQPYGARVGHVKDSRGNDWYLATPVRR
jgi:PhnB protein